jgi:hypothetical protein
MSLHGRHSRRHSPWMPLLVVVATAAAVALVATVAVVAWHLGSDTDTAGTRSGALPRSGVPASSALSSGNPDSKASSRAQAGAEMRAGCETAWARLTQVGLAADASLDQWRLHIDAMNQLVSGQITLEQASEYWNQTRIGSQHKLKAFRRLDAELRHSRGHCPTHRARGTRAEECARAVRDYRDALANARPAVATWARHIRDMDRLRAGKMSVDDAVAMWQMMWRKGERELARYDRSSRVAMSVDCGGH